MVDLRVPEGRDMELEFVGFVFSAGGELELVFEQDDSDGLVAPLCSSDALEGATRGGCALDGGAFSQFISIGDIGLLASCKPPVGERMIDDWRGGNFGKYGL